MRRWRNWTGNQRDLARGTATPGSTAELIDTIRDFDGPVKAVGAGHSFTDVAVTTGLRVDLGRLAEVVRVDGALVTVGAGMPLHRLNLLLAQHGLAMPNLGDIDAQTISGAISTGTHGTGSRIGGLATFVEDLTLVTASGTVRRFS